MVPWAWISSDELRSAEVGKSSGKSSSSEKRTCALMGGGARVAVMSFAHWFVHHPQHCPAAAAAEVAPHERGRDEQEDDVEVGRVVPADGGHLDLGVAGVALDAQSLEEELDRESGRDHRRVEAD